MLFFLIYGWDHYLPLDVSLGLPHQEELGTAVEYWSELVQWLVDAFQAVWLCQVKAQEWNWFHYNHGCKDIHYDLGVKVWLHVPHIVKQCSKKLCWLWKGLYCIVEIRGGLNYGLQNVHNPCDHQFMHVSCLKPWIGEETNEEVNLHLQYAYSGDLAPGLALTDQQAEIDTILNDQMTPTGVEYYIWFKGHTDHYNQWISVDDV